MYHSKWYEKEQCYWFGMTPNMFNKYKTKNTKLVEFELKGEGILALPFSIIEEVDKAYRSTGKDYSSYEMYIKKLPQLTLQINVEGKKWDVQDYFVPY